MSLVIKIGVRRCPECKEEVQKDANICPHCRTQLSEHPEWLKQKQQGGSCLIMLFGIITAVSGTVAASYHFFI